MTNDGTPTGARRTNFSWRVLQVVIWVGAIAGIAFMLIPSLTDPTLHRPMPECHRRMRQLLRGIHSYHGTYRCLPPAWTVTSGGTRLHSWRTLILPYVGHGEFYDRLRLNEPWDSPHNRTVAHEADPSIAALFRCPNAHPDDVSRSVTSYLAVVGPGTAWHPGRRLSLNDLLDGTSNTVGLVEVIQCGTHWMEPRDIDVAALSPDSDRAESQMIGSYDGVQFHDRRAKSYRVGLWDGSVTWAPATLSIERLRQLVIVDDGVPAPEDSDPFEQASQQ